MESKYRLLEDEKVLKHIVVRATSLASSGGIRESDREDFEQECRLKLIEVDDQYKPARGAPITFATKVIDNLANKCLRDSRAQKRCPQGMVDHQVELVAASNDHVNAVNSEIMEFESQTQRLGTAVDEFVKFPELSDRMKHLLSKISQEDRDLIRDISMSSVKQTAEWRGVSRYKVTKRRDYIRRQLKRFEES